MLACETCEAPAATEWCADCGLPVLDCGGPPDEPMRPGHCEESVVACDDHRPTPPTTTDGA